MFHNAYLLEFHVTERLREARERAAQSARLADARRGTARESLRVLLTQRCQQLAHMLWPRQRMGVERGHS